MQNQWQKQLVEKAVQNLVAAVGPKLEPGERGAIPTIYRRLFEVHLNALGTNQNMAAEVFEDIVRERIAELAALNASALKQAVLQDSFRSEVLPLDQTIETLGLSLLRGEKIEATARKNVGEACTRINELGRSLEREFPELQAELGPKISDSLLDCEFIRNGGTPTSLRLNRAARPAK